MSSVRPRRSLSRPRARVSSCSTSTCWGRPREDDESGFTLLELIIVTAVLPIIIGGLAIGLVAIFSLQTRTANRLADTEDAQVVSSTYLSDVQGAGYVTTQSSSQPQCGTGNQLLGLGNNFSSISNTFETSISYDSVANGDGTYSLVREVCTGGSTTPSSQSTVSNNLPQAQSVPTVLCNTATCDTGSAWITSQDITKVEFAVTETRTDPASTFSYTLAAVPQASATIVTGGQPLNSDTQAGCAKASPGSGTYANSLCFVDFSALSGNNLLAAEQGCLEMQVTLPGNDELFFCLSITGGLIKPSTLPTYTEAFLGNTNNGVPFYTNFDNSSGNPIDAALYQNVEGTTTTISFSGITVVNSNNVPATGWEVVSADAESTDSGESITWSSNTNLYVLDNSSTSVVGNACDAGAGLTGSGTTTIECNGNGTTSALKTGTAMVWALTPDTLTAKLVGTGLEAISFGLILS